MSKKLRKVLERSMAAALAVIMVFGLLPGGLLPAVTVSAANTTYTVENWNPYDATTNPNGYPTDPLEDGDTLILSVSIQTDSNPARTATSAAIIIPVDAGAEVTIEQTTSTTYNNVFFRLDGDNEVTVKDVKITGTQSAQAILNFISGDNKLYFDGENQLTQHRTSHGGAASISVPSGVKVEFNGTDEGILHAYQTAASGVANVGAAIGTVGSYSTAVGSSTGVATGTMIFNNGKVYAQSNGYGAGIGSGGVYRSATSGQGGSVTSATGHATVEIHGGEVHASSVNGAGIGVGLSYAHNNFGLNFPTGSSTMGTLYFYMDGGIVTASSTHGAGIGVGQARGSVASSAGATSTCTMRATGTVTIIDGDVTAESQYGDGIGSGIRYVGTGGGANAAFFSPFNVTINGGRVSARNVSRSASQHNPAGIGGAKIAINEENFADFGIRTIVKAEGFTWDVRASADNNLHVDSGNIQLVNHLKDGTTKSHNVNMRNSNSNLLTLFSGFMLEFNESINNGQYTYTATADNTDMIYVWLPDSTGKNALPYRSLYPRDSSTAYVDTDLVLYGDHAGHGLFTGDEGFLRIYNQATDELVFELDFSDETQRELYVYTDPNINDKAVITIPSNALTTNTMYYVTIDEGIFKDGIGYFNYEGISSKTGWTFGTGTEKKPEVIPMSAASFDPTVRATNVALDKQLTLTFQPPFANNLQILEGTVKIVEYGSLDIFEEITLPSDQVTVEGGKVIITPSKLLEENTQYSVFITPDAIYNPTTHQSYSGVEYRSAWYFTTGGVGELRPTGYSPANNSTGVYKNTPLTITFNENIQIEQGKSVYLYKALGDSLEMTLTHSQFSSPMSVSGNTLTIQPTADLDGDTQYYVLVEDGLVSSRSKARVWGGIADKDGWTFITNNKTGLFYTELAPPDGSTNVNTTVNLSITFNEDAQKGSGYFRVYNSSGSLQAMVSVADATIAGNVAMVTVNGLDEGESYYVVVDEGAFLDDGAGTKAFVGVGARAWSFTTKGGSGSGGNGGGSNTPTVVISGAETVDVPLKTAGTANTAQYQATAYIANVEQTGANFYWQIEGIPPTDVSINGNTGVLSVGYRAQSGYVIISATYDGVTATKAVYINRVAEPVSTVPRIVGENAIQIPSSGSVTEPYTLNQYDADETDRVLTGIFWFLTESVPGVSIDELTGVLAVSNTAGKGFVTLRAYDSNTGASYTKDVLLYNEAVRVETVELDGPEGIDIPASGQDAHRVQYTALAYDQYEMPMLGERFTYRLASSVTGVTLDTNTGVILVASNAADGATFTIIATLDSNSGKTVQKTVKLSKGGEYQQASRLVILDTDMEFELPVTGELTQHTFTAKVYNQYGQEMDDTSAVRWQIEGAGLTDVSIGYTDGILTVKPTASTGSIVVKAVVNGMSDSVSAVVYRGSVRLSRLVIKEGPRTMDAPATGISYGDFHAVAYDQYDGEISGAKITFGFSGGGAVTGAEFEGNTLILQPSLTENVLRVVASCTIGGQSLESGIWTVRVNTSDPGEYTYRIGGASYIFVPGSGASPAQEQYSYLRNGSPIGTDVLWTLESGPEGVSIDQQTGVMSVASGTALGTAVITAIPKDINLSELSATVRIMRAGSTVDSLALTGDLEVDIPATTSVTNRKSYLAQLYDQYGTPMSGDILWALTDVENANTDYVKLENGLLTVLCGAVEQTITITATSKTNASATDTIQVELKNVEDTAAGYLQITGEPNLTIPGGTAVLTEAYTATVYNYNGVPLPGEIAELSVEVLPEGVSFQDNGDGTGSLTVTSAAVNGQVVVTARSGGATAYHTITLTRAPSKVEHPDDVTIGGASFIYVSGEYTSEDYYVTVRDQYNREVVPDSVEWSIVNTPVGVYLVGDGTVVVVPTVTVSQIQLQATVNGSVVKTKDVEIINPNPVVPSGGGINVTVQDGSNGHDPLSGVSVDSGSLVRTTGDGGTVSFNGLEPGSYLLIATHGQYNTASALVEISGTETKSVTIVMYANSSGGTGGGGSGTDAYTISGKTMDSQGVALSGVTVSVSGKTATSDSSGRYIVTNLTDGQYTLSYAKPGYIGTAEQVEIDGGDETNVYAYLAALPTPDSGKGVLYGQVTDRVSGDPISGASVDIGGGQTGVTDASGYYVFPRVEPGSYLALVTAAGYNTGFTTVKVQADRQTRQNMQLSADDSGSGGGGGNGGAGNGDGSTYVITGTVTSAQTGQPVAGATVRNSVTGASVTADESGRYAIGPYDGGTSVSLTATAEGYASASATAAVVDRDVTQNFRLNTAGSGGQQDTYTVTGPDSVSVPGTGTYQLWLNGGKVDADSWQVSPTGSGVSIDGDGKLTVTGDAVPGTVTITGIKDGNQVEKTVTLGYTGEKTVQLIGGDAVEIPAAGQSANTLQFTAKAFHGQAEMKDPAITWSVSDYTGVTITSTGLLQVGSQAAEGVVVVTAAWDTASASKTVKLSRGAAEAASLHIIGGATDIYLPQSGSRTYTYFAVVLDQYGKVIADADIQWTADNGFAIDAQGVLTVSHDSTPGTLTLEARHGALTDTMTVEVGIYDGNDQYSLTFTGYASGLAMEIPGRGEPDETHQFVFEAKANGQTVADPNVTWAIVGGAPTGVSLSGGTLTVDSTAVPGQFMVTAAWNGLVVPVEVELSRGAGEAASLHIIGGASDIYLPQSGSAQHPYLAVVLDQYGRALENVSIDWSVDNAMGIDQDGVLTVTDATATGPATVTAQYQKLTDTLDVTIHAHDPSRPVYTLTFDGYANGLTMEIPGGGEPDEKHEFALEAQADGQPVSDPDVKWTILGGAPEGVSLTDGELKVTSGAVPQTMTVLASWEGLIVPVQAELTRGTAQAASLHIVSGRTELYLPRSGSAAYPYTAVVLDQYGRQMTAGAIQWSADNGYVIDQTGSLTLEQNSAVGVVTVTAQCGGLSDSLNVTVEAYKAGEGEYTLTVTGQSGGLTMEIPGQGEPDEAHTFVFEAQADGQPVSNPAVSWTIVGGAPTGVSLSGDTLTVDSTASPQQMIVIASWQGLVVPVQVELVWRTGSAVQVIIVGSETVEKPESGEVTRVYEVVAYDADGRYITEPDVTWTLPAGFTEEGDGAKLTVSSSTATGVLTVKVSVDGVEAQKAVTIVAFGSGGGDNGNGGGNNGNGGGDNGNGGGDNGNGGGDNGNGGGNNGNGGGNNGNGGGNNGNGGGNNGNGGGNNGNGGGNNGNGGGNNGNGGGNNGNGGGNNGNGGGNNGNGGGGNGNGGGDNGNGGGDNGNGGGNNGNGGGDNGNGGNGEYPMLNTEEHMAYIEGYSDGTVKPERGMNRAEAAVILYRLIVDEAKETPIASTFSDVAGDEWYAQAVCYLAQRGIIQGYPDGTFGPARQITRAEFVTMLSRFYSLKSGGALFSDVDSSYWAYAQIRNATARGWIEGYPDGTFGPEREINRAEAVTVLNRVLERKTRAQNIPAGLNRFTDLEASQWFYADILEASVSHEFERQNDGFETWISW